MLRRQLECCWMSENQFCINFSNVFTQNPKHIHNITILVFHMLSFFVNAVILFWRSNMLLTSRPWSDKFSCRRRSNISVLSGMQASQDQFHQLMKLGLHCAVEGKLESSSQTHVLQLFLATAIELLCGAKGFQCSGPRSSQSFENIRDWSGRTLIEFWHIRLDFRQRSSQMFRDKHFAMNHAVCVCIMLGTFSLIRATDPGVLASHWSGTVGTCIHIWLPRQFWLWN